MPNDQITKNVLAEGWTVWHHDGTKSQITKDFLSDSYTIRHQSGAKASVTKDMLSDTWTIHLPNGNKMTISKSVLSDNWTLFGSGGSGSVRKNILAEGWTLEHDRDENVFAAPKPTPPAPQRTVSPIPNLEPMPIDAPAGSEVGPLIDPRLASFAASVTFDGMDTCLYAKDVWKVRSALNPMTTLPTLFAITTGCISWEGFEVYEERGFLRSRKQERRVLRIIGIGDVQAEIAKGAWWPQSPSYELLLHRISGSISYSIQHPEAVTYLREVVGVLKRVGIETHDRHDIFWPGGGDPHYRPPLDD